MSAAYPLPTNADEWLRRRAKSLGASESAAATGRSPWMSNVELWEVKTGRRRRPDLSGNPAVERGKAAEPLIRALFALDHPEYAVTYGGAWDVVSRAGEPWYMATLDGRLVERETGAPGILEIKSGALSSRATADSWAGRVPDHYFCQILHQLNAWAEAQFAVLVAYLEDAAPSIGRTHSMRCFRFDRADVAEDAAFLFDEECLFWHHVITDTEPALILPVA